MMRWMVAYGMLFMLVACGSGVVPPGDSASEIGDDGDGDPGSVTAVSFSSDVQAIFTAGCIVTTCHGGLNPQSGMSLESGSAYGSLVNAAASSTTGAAYRVIPNDSAGSALYQRVSGEGLAAGELTMPQGGGSLSTSEIDSIETWIDEGAQNN